LSRPSWSQNKPELILLYPPVFVKCKPTEINKNLHREQGLTENGGYIEPQEQPKHPDDLPW
jgi:hypothetical protein